MQYRPPSVPTITGTTDVYLILGDPVEQVRAPETFNPLFARLGLQAVLVPVLVPATSLKDFVNAAFAAPNIKGLWVTMPHKEAMLGLLSSYSELARIAGAVNAVRRNAQGQLEGGLFDGEGLLASLAYFGMHPVDKRVLILGAGGAAAAIGASLALQRPGGRCAEIAFYNPALEKAQELAARLRASTGCLTRAVSSNDPAGFDLVINASPLGMAASDAMPCQVSRLESHAAVMDIVMKNQPTPWVRAARARGLNAQPGFEMLIQQTPLYLDFFGFTQAALDVRQDATALRESLYPDVLQNEIRRAHPVSAALTFL